jgi:hypothetical protein
MSRFWRSSLAGPVFIIASLAAAAPQAAAQCGPDGFTGLCCTPVTPTLPFFPNARLPGVNICWNGCSVANQVAVTVDWTPLVQVSCTEYITTLTVTDVNSSVPIVTGLMVLDYTRTWDEIDPSGAIHQVWRFVAKADLSPASPVAWTCEAPNCIPPNGPHQTAFYYGSVDSAHDCTPGSLFENSIVLHHASDFFIHKPWLSDRPGVFHPKDSYAIVAPHSTAQPFVPMNQIAPNGPFFGEATRDMASIAPPPCFDEDYISSGSAKFINALCMSTFSSTPKQHTFRRFTGKGSCLNASGLPGTFQSLKLAFPTLPWFHLVSTSIGTWTNGSVWPGKESAWVDEGLFIHRNVCTGDFLDVNYGATTKDGWMILHPVLLTTMTDLADNFTLHLGGTGSFPVLGSIRPTEKLIYTFSP